MNVLFVWRQTYIDFATTQHGTKGPEHLRTACFDTLLNFRPHTYDLREGSPALENEVLGERDPFYVGSRLTTFPDEVLWDSGADSLCRGTLL